MITLLCTEESILWFIHKCELYIYIFYTNVYDRIISICKTFTIFVKNTRSFYSFIERGKNFMIYTYNCVHVAYFMVCIDKVLKYWLTSIKIIYVQTHCVTLLMTYMLCMFFNMDWNSINFVIIEKSYSNNLEVVLHSYECEYLLSFSIPNINC